MDAQQHIKAAEELLIEAAKNDRSATGSDTSYARAARDQSANLTARAQVHAILADLLLKASVELP